MAEGAAKLHTQGMVGMPSDIRRIIAETKTKRKLLLRVRELKDRSILYSIPPLDGRERARLYSEQEAEVPSGGQQTFRYEDGKVVLEDIDHLTYHAEGPHVISAPASASHWGRIVQRPIDKGPEDKSVGLFLPATLARFPDYDRDFDPTCDTKINLTALNVEYVHFRLSILPTRLTREKAGSFEVSDALISHGAQNLQELFRSGISWFLLPLQSCTVLFVVGTADPPYPPRNVFVRWEQEVGGKVHVAYFE